MPYFKNGNNCPRLLENGRIQPSGRLAQAPNQYHLTKQVPLGRRFAGYVYSWSLSPWMLQPERELLLGLWRVAKGVHARLNGWRNLRHRWRPGKIPSGWIRPTDRHCGRIKGPISTRVGIARLERRHRIGTFSRPDQPRLLLCSEFSGGNTPPPLLALIDEFHRHLMQPPPFSRFQ